MPTPSAQASIKITHRFYPDRFIPVNSGLFCGFLMGRIQHILPKEGEPMG
jgi:hypothetical protein